MRTIDFRTWDGKAYYYPSDVEILSFEKKGRWFLLTQNGDLICNFTNGVLEQFTGLCDKNGKKIYENDRINSSHSVVYIAPSYVLREITSGDIIPMYEQDKREVTGNDREI